MTDLPPTPTTPPPPPPPTPDPLSALNTWAQSIGAREKAEGRDSAAKAAAEQLGMTVEEAAAFITEKKEAERAGMAEADRKLAEATDKEAAAERKQAEATNRELNAEKRAALVDAGLSKDQAKLLVDLVKVDTADWDEAKVETAVAELKKVMPQLFTPGAEDEEGEPPAGTSPRASGPADSAPRGGLPKTPPPASMADKARARLTERHPELANKE